MRNPGFEGEIYQSTIRCASGGGNTCVDDDPWSAWPAGYWNGATFEIFYGASQGRTGTISGYSAANGSSGGTFTFAQNGVAPATGDYMIVRLTVPGNVTAGWWPSTSGSGAITTNSSDLPPGTTGRQTAAVKALSASDSAVLNSYFDGDAGRSFVLLKGTYQLSFKAKGTGGSNSISVFLQRPGFPTYLSQTVALTNGWANYSYSFTAAESGSNLSSVALQLGTVGADSFLIDDVSLVQTNSNPSNPTAFTDPVVSTLQTLQPGSLRFWAGQLGDTLDNLISDQFGRQRAGYLAWYTEQDDISYGLHEFLQLCATIGAEPWFVVPSTFSTTDASHLIEYLAGSSSTPYGAKRAARGQTNPWTSSFTKIHLEFGNEAWNGAFKGGTIEYTQPYGQRAQAIFGAMRGNAAYVPSAFDLVLGGQAVWAGRNQDIQNNCNNNDSFAVAPYMMNTVDSTSTEDLFGSSFAEPEAYVSPSGTAEGVTGGLMTLNQQALQASSHPVPLVMYEMNLSTLQGNISQSALNSYVSSLGAGLAVSDAMLQQMAQGVLTQNLWNLTQYNFVRPDGLTANLWGAVVDMGVTNQRRPQFLTLQMINQAIGANAAMLQTVHTGANPTWNQGLVNTVQLSGAHYLQSYAFSNGSSYSLVVFNLHRSASLPVTFSGANAPSGNVGMTVLTSANLTDTNENAALISPVVTASANFNPSAALSLPPFSMTVLTWTGGSPTGNPGGGSTGGTTAPAIGSVAASSIATTSATITWTTDQGATSQAEYGTTTAYGSQSANDTSLLASHSVSLTGLTPGTTYNYAVISANSAGQSSTSANFTFSTVAATAPPPPSSNGISRVGGAHNNTSTASAPTSLAIGYSSSSGNTVVVTCALGNTTSSISSITDSGSAWSLRASVNNGTAVRSEIWSTAAGGSVASKSFVVNLAGGTPASCALEEYAGVQAIGNTSTAQAVSGSWSASLKTQDPNNYIVAGLGANSYYGYTAQGGTILQQGGLTANGGNNYAETALCDGTAAAAGTVSCASITSSAPWAAPALELRTGGPASSPPPATSIPAISAVTASGVTSNSATITWTTDQPSSSQVEYGPNSGYGTLSTYSAALTVSHSVTITGLAAGITWNYAVISAGSGGTATSGNFTFSTPAIPVGPVISGVSASGVTANSAIISWTTDTASSTQAEYGTTMAYGTLSALSAGPVTSHSVTLTGLTPGTAYDYAGISGNSGGTTTSANFTFTTPAAAGGGPSPVLQNVSYWGITGNAITVSWATDQLSNTSIQYGTTAAMSQTGMVQTALTIGHGGTLSGLTNNAVYYFRAVSSNGSGITGYSQTYTFKTLDTTAPVISNITVTPASGNSATASWSLSKAASTQVEYGRDTSYGLWSGATSATSTALGWVPSGTIHYRIHSADSSGNQSVSPDATFIEP
jgi:hypothetical protein